MNYYNQFIDVLGPPSSDSNLFDYINFVIKSSKNINENEYYENHHILPKCLFENDDTFKLKYSDHIEAHKLKEKWKDPEYKTKMKKRKSRGSDGSKMKELWADPVWKANMLNKRAEARKRKLNETK